MNVESNLRRVRFDGLLYLCNAIVTHVPSHTLRKLFYREVMGFKIGDGSYIFCGARFDTQQSFQLGHHSTINERCRLDNRGTLTIGNNVSISSEVCILTADHDPKTPAFSSRNRPVVIEDFVFIGTRAMILPDVTIGRGAIVAAGAIVTKDVAALSIVAGCPAKVIGQRDPALGYTVDYCRLFA